MRHDVRNKALLSSVTIEKCTETQAREVSRAWRFLADSPTPVHLAPAVFRRHLRAQPVCSDQHNDLVAERLAEQLRGLRVSEVSLREHLCVLRPAPCAVIGERSQT